MAEWAVGSGHLATSYVLRTYSATHFAAPATQRPSNPAIQRLAPASSLQPPASGSLLPSTPLPPVLDGPPPWLCGILDLGAWGLSVPLLLVSSHSLQYARPAPESRQTPERATNLMIPNRPPQTSPCCAHHLASPLLSVTSPCPDPVAVAYQHQPVTARLPPTHRYHQRPTPGHNCAV